MPAILSGSKVLVTGVNGFYGSWISKELLDRGFSVRGTVRSTPKGDEVQKVFNNPALEIVVVPDITQPGAFDEAVKDVDAAIHTASPVGLPEGDPSVLIGPAVAGTKSLLESAKSAGNQLKRVVVTSSISAVSDPLDHSSRTYSEADWNETSIKEVSERGKDAVAHHKYNAAKTLAERAVWDFAEQNKDTISFDVVTTLPAVTWGPLVLPISTPTDASGSMVFLWSWVKNPDPDPSTYGNFFTNIADIRDAAKMHAEALVHENAGGHRFILSPHPISPQVVYDAINSSNELKSKKVTAPTGNPGARPQAPYQCNEEPARTILGITARPIEETIVVAVSAFADAGMLP